MKKCDMFIGNDSGLMHLAASAMIPTVGLFGPSDSIKYSPWGNKTLAITSPLSPEELMGKTNFSAKKTKSLMNELKVETVFKKINHFYSSFK